MPHGNAGDALHARVAGDDLRLDHQVLQVVGRVLGVEQQPVEAGRGADLGFERPEQAAPQPYCVRFSCSVFLKALIGVCMVSSSLR
jgi:hypothetical protein